MAEGLVKLTEYTDATCPYAFSAEPDRLALRWHYGDQLEWTTRMVVLNESRAEIAALGYTSELASQNNQRLATLYGMPISSAPRPQFPAAEPAALALKAVQLCDPARADCLMRALEVAWHSDRQLIDEIETTCKLAAGCGVDPVALKRWIAEAPTALALDADKQAARSPLPAALGPFNHKLAGPEDQRRYTCPSLEFRSATNADLTLVAPGFQSLKAYEALIANIAPEIKRRPSAEDPLEILRWADWPLAAVEVGRVMDMDRDTASRALAGAGAREDSGYWTV